MNASTLATIAQNVGFKAEIVKGQCIVSLNSRPVTTQEVAFAMSIPVQSCKRDGKSVVINF